MISLIIGAMVVVSMVSAPTPDQRAEAMKVGSFDCRAALEDDTTFEADVWSYCSGVYGKTQWGAMVRAKTDAVWDEIAQKAAAEKQEFDAKNAELTALGQRAAKR